jgi:hypothetical protein
MRDAGVGLLVVLAVMFAPSARAADPVVQWDAAEQHMGEQAIVEGRVLGVHCSPTRACWPSTTFNHFTAVCRLDFTLLPAADGRYSGRVGARHHRGPGPKPEIEVSDPADRSWWRRGRSATRRRRQPTHRIRCWIGSHAARSVENLSERLAQMGSHGNAGGELENQAGSGLPPPRCLPAARTAHSRAKAGGHARLKRGMGRRAPADETWERLPGGAAEPWPLRRRMISSTAGPRPVSRRISRTVASGGGGSAPRARGAPRRRDPGACSG